MILSYVIVAIFVSFPEALLTLLIGFNLCNVRNIKTSKLIIVGVIQAIVALLVRISNIYLGVHTIVQIVSLYILVVIVFKIKYYKAIIPVLIGSLSQGLLQSITLPIIEFVFNIELDNLYYSIRSSIFCAVPIFALSLILLMIIKKNGFSLFNIGS